MKCRHCRAELSLPFIDLGTAPPSNAYLTREQLDQPETYYPLRVLTCTSCWLVQTEEYARRDDLFADDYAYFSSYSSSWLAHAEAYVAEMVERLALGPASQVVEIASNDGYLLQYVRARGIPCLGVEPTTGTARAARERGIETHEAFFDVALAAELVAEGRSADLAIANNVLAHVPDINDFVAGIASLLKPQGVASFEFPHLLRLIADCQFDTIYHEHYSYLSLTAVHRILERNGLAVFDVAEFATHGGSLRVLAQRSGSGRHAVAASVAKVLDAEESAGFTGADAYRGMQRRVDALRDDFTSFLIDARRAGRRVAAYGAAAKGNTLMNYAGVHADMVAFVADRNPAKQGRYMPGSRIPIVTEDHLRSDRPDYVVLLPWNLRAELTVQLDYVRAWGGRFVTAVPKLTWLP